MKNNRLLTICACVLLASCACEEFAILLSPAYGQNPKTATATRLRFKKGESSTTVRGQLSSKRLERDFLLGGRAGQELHIEVREGQGDARIEVIDPSGKSVASNGSGNDDLTVRLKQSGVYRIEVSPPGKFYRDEGFRRMAFSLFISIN